MKDTLKIRKRGGYKTRSSEMVFLDHGDDGLHTGFANPTSKIWNKAPSKVKKADSLYQAKKSIREYVVESIPI